CLAGVVDGDGIARYRPGNAGRAVHNDPVQRQAGGEVIVGRVRIRNSAERTSLEAGRGGVEDQRVATGRRLVLLPLGRVAPVIAARRRGTDRLGEGAIGNKGGSRRRSAGQGAARGVPVEVHRAAAAAVVPFDIDGVNARGQVDRRLPCRCSLVKVVVDDRGGHVVDVHDAAVVARGGESDRVAGLAVVGDGYVAGPAGQDV